MSRGRQSHPRPGLPMVNLLSPAAFEMIAAGRLRRRFVFAGLSLVVLVAALWGVQHLRVGETEKLVVVERAETTRLNAETTQLLPVKAFVAGVAAQQQTVQTTMEREIYFSEILADIRSSTPAGANLDSLAITLAAAPVAVAAGAAPVPVVSPCPGPDPFNTLTVVGCVTLSGTATSRAVVGDLVLALDQAKLFVEPFINTTTAGDGAVSFSGSVGLSQAVFSKRYGNPVPTGDVK